MPHLNVMNGMTRVGETVYPTYGEGGSGARPNAWSSVLNETAMAQLAATTGYHGL